MRKALVIGINDYPGQPLAGCVNDAVKVSELLRVNGDGSPNFDTVCLTSPGADASADTLARAVSDLFRGDAETAVLYFAGHGIIDPDTDAGFIVSVDGRKPAWGVALGDVISQAGRAHPRIRSSVIILDCCQSGFAGEVPALNNRQLSVVGTGVTILTAAHREQPAADGLIHGLFTEILLDGLAGAASDICGNITPAALYSHVDQTLGPWEQRPIYKANVQSFVTLRKVAPKVPLETLRRLPQYFPQPTYEFPLDPSYEPDRIHVSEDLKGLPVDQDNARVFAELQRCHRHGLVAPVDAPHMFDAAIKSKACRLTASGAHYRRLADLGRL